MSPVTLTPFKFATPNALDKLQQWGTMQRSFAPARQPQRAETSRRGRWRLVPKLLVTTWCGQERTRLVSTTHETRVNKNARDQRTRLVSTTHRTPRLVSTTTHQTRTCPQLACLCPNQVLCAFSSQIPRTRTQAQRVPRVYFFQSRGLI